MAQTVNGNKSLVYVASAILAAGILVSAGLILVPTSHSTTTVTSTSTTTSTTTLTTYPGLLAYCASANSYTQHENVDMVVGTSPPAILCLQLYDINSTSPIVVDTASLVSVQGSEQGFVGGGNFTVIASQDQLTLGGPSNLNEGTIVAYAITARPGANGTYSLQIGGWHLIGIDEELCPFYGQVIAGTGQPNYFRGLDGGGSPCTVINTLPNGSVKLSPAEESEIPGVANGYVMNSTLYFKAIDVVDSTQ
jgi:hypothetical protein